MGALGRSGEECGSERDYLAEILHQTADSRRWPLPVRALCCSVLWVVESKCMGYFKAPFPHFFSNIPACVLTSVA